MANDLTIPLQTAITTLINADAPLTALVNDRIYSDPPETLAFPYVVTPMPDAIVNRYKGGFGQSFSVTFDAFSQAPDGEELGDIMAAIVDIFETPATPDTGNHSGLTVAGGSISMCQVVNQRVIMESDNRTRHGIVELLIRTRSY